MTVATMTSLPLEVQPAVFDSMQPEEQTWLQELDDFTAPYLEEKMLHDEHFTSGVTFRYAFHEFKKFVALCYFVGDEIGMTSETVDAVWHQFILFTPQYHSFCDHFLNHYLHHVPETSHTESESESVLKFADAYERMFGVIPSVWSVPGDGATASCRPQCSKPKPPTCSRPPKPLPRPQCGPRHTGS